MKRIYLLFFLAISSFLANGQLALTDFNSAGRGGVATTFATDYQTIGINPANLGYRKSFRDPRITVGFFENSVNLSSDALTRTDLFNTIFKSSTTSFNYDEKVAAAEKFADKNFSANIDMMVVGASIKLPGGHGIAINIRDRIQFHGKFNGLFSEFMFLGGAARIFPFVTVGNVEKANPRYFNEYANEVGNGNDLVDRGGRDFMDTEADFPKLVSGQYPEADIDKAPTYAEVFDGSRMSSSWYREYNVSYGKQVFESYDLELFVGAGVKYIQGFWLQDFVAEGGRFVTNNLAHSPTFGINFATSENDTTSVTPPTNPLNILFPKSTGNGYGFDLGFTMIIRDNLHIGFAVNNIGKIVWKGDRVEVYESDNPLDSRAKLNGFGGYGFNNFNFLAKQEGFGFAGENEAFPFSSKEGGKTITELPSTYRFGASYEFFRTVHVGFDLVIPRNDVAGNIESPLIAVGGDFRPTRTIRVSTGFNFGGNNGDKINFPAGITYTARRGFYELGVATSDLSTLLVDLGTGSTFSVAGGFLRFKIL